MLGQVHRLEVFMLKHDRQGQAWHLNDQAACTRIVPFSAFGVVLSLCVVHLVFSFDKLGCEFG